MAPRGAPLAGWRKIPQKVGRSPERARLQMSVVAESFTQNERSLKDAGALPSFRTDPAAEAGLEPVRSPVATPQRPFSVRARPEGPFPTDLNPAEWAV